MKPFDLKKDKPRNIPIEVTIEINHEDGFIIEYKYKNKVESYGLGIISRIVEVKE